MYQFTEMFGEIKVTPQRKTYRWWGLLVELLTGWIPAWGVMHATKTGILVFILVWLSCMALGFGIGSMIKK